MGKIIKAPSGDFVEIKDVKETLIIVYQLNENNERILVDYPKGRSELIGIIIKSKIINQIQ